MSKYRVGDIHEAKHWVFEGGGGAGSDQLSTETKAPWSPNSALFEITRYYVQERI